MAMIQIDIRRVAKYDWLSGLGGGGFRGGGREIGGCFEGNVSKDLRLDVK